MPDVGVVRDDLPARYFDAGEYIECLEVGGFNLNIYQHGQRKLLKYFGEDSHYVCDFYDGCFTQQYNVWQHNMPRGFARSVMDYFISYSGLVSASTQRPKGVLMWKKFLREKLGEANIYLYNKGLHLAENKATLEFLIESAWQGNSHHKQWVVSRTPVDVGELQWHLQRQRL